MTPRLHGAFAHDRAVRACALLLSVPSTAAKALARLVELGARDIKPNREDNVSEERLRTLCKIAGVTL